MLKALAGGEGRGPRTVRGADQLDDAYRCCAAEAQLGFGAVFAEESVEDARHIEVQTVADGVRVMALGGRDRSIPRHYQKPVEIAPAQELPAALRTELHRAAARLCDIADPLRVGSRSITCLTPPTDPAGRRIRRPRSRLTM